MVVAAVQSGDTTRAYLKIQNSIRGVLRRLPVTVRHIIHTYGVLVIIFTARRDESPRIAPF